MVAKSGTFFKSTVTPPHFPQIMKCAHVISKYQSFNALSEVHTLMPPPSLTIKARHPKRHLFDVSLTFGGFPIEIRTEIRYRVICLLSKRLANKY